MATIIRKLHLLIKYPAISAHAHEYEEEGQHPLTGQCAANFRLLANQAAERRLVTQ